MVRGGDDAGNGDRGAYVSGTLGCVPHLADPAEVKGWHLMGVFYATGQKRGKIVGKGAT